MPRKPLGKRPMTQTERNARSKERQRDEILAHINLALCEASDWAKSIHRGRPGATDSDIAYAFDQLAAHLLTIEHLVTKKESSYDDSTDQWLDQAKNNKP